MNGNVRGGQVQDVLSTTEPTFPSELLKCLGKGVNLVVRPPFACPSKDF